MNQTTKILSSWAAASQDVDLAFEQYHAQLSYDQTCSRAAIQTLEGELRMKLQGSKGKLSNLKDIGL
jgi:hypothetical protein